MKSSGIVCLICSLLLTVSNSPAQQWDWVQRFSGSGTTGTAVGVDDVQNIYVGGVFSGTNYIGTNRIASDGGQNLFIAKFNSFGIPLWAITASGSLGKMLAASNGTVFVCGNLSFSEPVAPQSITNVFLARLDEGQVTWTAPLPDGSTSVGRMAFGPDETVFVVGATNQVFIHQYTQAGTLLGGIGVRAEQFTLKAFTPTAIAVGPSWEIYIAGRGRTTNLYTTEIADFTAHVSHEGEIVWTRFIGASAYYYINQIQDIAATSDGGVVSVGFRSTPLPNKWAFVVKHSMTGTQEWSTGASGYFKSFFSAEAVDVGADGKIHITGSGQGSYHDANRLMILTVSSEGERLSTEYIPSYVRGDANNGTDITVDKTGGVFVTGTLTGQPIFGTNKLSYLPRGGFVAHRYTLFPELMQQQIANEVILSWPLAAFPFALQQSSDGGSNWFFVTTPPQRNDSRFETVLSATDDGALFRLFRTNDLPIQHIPRIFVSQMPGMPFLEYNRILIAGPSSNVVSRLGAFFDDEDENPLTVTWTNLQTGEPLTNAISVNRYAGLNDWQRRYPPYYAASVALDASMFPTGRYLVSVSVSDGTFTVSTNYPEFEVITYEAAVEEFLATMEPLRADRSGRQALKFLEAFRQSRSRERIPRAEKHWRHFQRELARVASLSDDARQKLASGAEMVKSFL